MKTQNINPQSKNNRAGKNRIDLMTAASLAAGTAALGMLAGQIFEIGPSPEPTPKPAPKPEPDPEPTPKPATANSQVSTTTTKPEQATAPKTESATDSATATETATEPPAGSTTTPESATWTEPATEPIDPEVLAILEKDEEDEEDIDKPDTLHFLEFSQVHNQNGNNFDGVICMDDNGNRLLLVDADSDGVFETLCDTEGKPAEHISYVLTHSDIESIIDNSGGFLAINGNDTAQNEVPVQDIIDTETGTHPELAQNTNTQKTQQETQPAQKPITDTGSETETEIPSETEPTIEPAKPAPSTDKPSSEMSDVELALLSILIGGTAKDGGNDVPANNSTSTATGVETADNDNGDDDQDTDDDDSDYADEEDSDDDNAAFDL